MNNLVNISDSVGSSFRMDVRENNYGHLLARRLKLEYVPFIMLGAATDKVLDLVNHDSELIRQIQNARVVCLTMGANNILLPILVEATASVGVPLDGRTLSRAIDTFKRRPWKVATMIRSISAAKTRSAVEKGLEGFFQEMPRIIRRIHDLNPQAILILQTAYFLEDAVKNRLFRLLSKTRPARTVASYYGKINEWIRSEENRKNGQYVLNDLALAMKNDRGQDYLTGLKNSDIHLSDAGHLFNYKLMYNALAQQYPEFACAEEDGVVLQRKKLTYKEKLIREKADEKVTGSPYFGPVKTAIMDALSRDELDITPDTHLYELGVTFLDVFLIASNLEKRFPVENRPITIVPMGHFSVAVTPRYFMDILNGMMPESVVKRTSELLHYEDIARRDDGERCDSQGMKTVKSVIRNFMQDETAVIRGDMRFLSDLKMNRLDLFEVGNYVLLEYLTSVQILNMDKVGQLMPFLFSEDPASVTVQQMADYVDAQFEK